MKFIPTEPQRIALEHLIRNPRALLLMGCGLGKTAVVLHAVKHLMEDGACGGVLVVAPVRVCNLTWPAEARKWDGLGLRVANLRTIEGRRALKRRRAHVYLCNYEMLPRIRSYLKKRIEHKGAPFAFDTVVWDELTRAKNPSSRRINKVRFMLHKVCDRHWGMTGTPIPNGYLDLFAQVRLIDHGQRLGTSMARYRSQYFYAEDYMQYNWKPLRGAKRAIHKRIADITCVLRTSDWLDIPETHVEEVECTLPQEARDTYRQLEKEFLAHLGKAEILAPSAAVLVNKLAQCASGTVYDAERVPRRLHDVKLRALKPLLARYRKQREPVIVICNYQHEIARVVKAFPQARRFDAAKTEATQNALLRDWDAGRIPVLVAHPASLGHGLNMQHGGRAVVFFSLPWSSELYEQTIRRVARTGQTEVTEVTHIACTGTIDEVILDVLRKKDKTQSAMLESLKTFYQKS